MIRATIEMWPGGDESRRYPLGHINIANQCVTTVQSAGRRGDYTAQVFGKSGKPIREARVLGWPRLSRPVFALVWEVLTKAGYATVRR
jgi:hypothetical protein